MKQFDFNKSTSQEYRSQEPSEPKQPQGKPQNKQAQKRQQKKTPEQETNDVIAALKEVMDALEKQSEPQPQPQRQAKKAKPRPSFDELYAQLKQQLTSVKSLVKDLIKEKKEKRWWVTAAKDMEKWMAEEIAMEEIAEDPQIENRLTQIAKLDEKFDEYDHNVFDYIEDELDKIDPTWNLSKRYKEVAGYV